jgi:hypothetical protein
MPCESSDRDRRRERSPAGLLRKLAMLTVCGGVIAYGATWVAGESRKPAAAVPQNTLQYTLAPGESSPGGLIPRDFQYVIDDLKVVSKGQVIVADGFDRDGVLAPSTIRGKSTDRAPYLVSRGLIDGSRVRGGHLVMDQRGMVNTFENYSADLVVPIDESGRTWFVGKELFGDLEVSCKVIAPRIAGPSRFSIGLIDLTNWFAMGAVSIGPEEVRLQRQGHPRFPYLPFINSRFDRVDLLPYKNLEAVEMTLRIGAQGQLTGNAKIHDSGVVQSFDLTAKPDWAKLDPEAQYSIQLLWETWPKPRLFAFHPQYVKSEELRETGGLLELTVFGIGVFDNSEVEIFRMDGKEKRQAEVREVKSLLMRHGVTLKVILPYAYKGDYTVRVNTAGETAEVRNAFRVG